MTVKQGLHVLAALIAASGVGTFVEAAPAVRTGLAIFTLIGWLWISEALHISVTALLVPLVTVLAGVFPVREALTRFADPVIFLFMGGFALAAALQRHGLDHAFALRVLALSRGRPLATIVLLFAVTAALSMWISNTATVALMLPLALGLLRDRDPDSEPALYLFVLLGLAYAGNLGGMATLIGSPPNAIAAAEANLDFRGWASFGLPAFVVLFPVMIGILLLVLRPRFGESLTLSVDAGASEGRAQLPVLIVFALTAAGWIFSAPLAQLFGIGRGFDALVALAAIVLLIGGGWLPFAEFTRKTGWDILILFGGGLTLSAAMQVSGASAFLAAAIVAVLPVGQPWLVLLIICTFVIFLTELMSNTASAALLVPLFMTLAPGFGFEPPVIAVIIALCASCAFMLPVATPPNALVFGSGFVPQRQMMRTGLVLNLVISVVLATLFWLRFG